MTESEQQKMFTLYVAQLILFAYARGYQITLGEAWRPPEMVKIYETRGTGSGNSLHPRRLAIDLNLFKGDVWLTQSTDHAELGAYWKSLHPLCRWGGDFKPPARPDGNHYSMEWKGAK